MRIDFARAAAAGLLIGALGASAPAAAQDYGWAAGYNAGGVLFTPLNENGGGFEIKPATGWIVGLQFERWLGSGRIGLRVNGAITERPLELPAGVDPDIAIWMADADVLLRLLSADPGRSFNMFLSLGGGAVRYKLGDGDFLNFEGANASYPGNDRPRWSVNGGLGFDILTGWRWDDGPVGIRVEAVDHVALDSPFSPIAGDDFSPIHNLRVVIGAFTGFGVLR